MQATDSSSQTERDPVEVDSKVYQDILPRIARGNVIPILSNSMLNEWVFSGIQSLPKDEAPDPTARQDLTVNEWLAKTWAEETGYPLQDGYVMARVAQYNLAVNFIDSTQAKSEYLKFLKKQLLLKAQADGRPADRLQALSRQVDSTKLEVEFAKITRELDYTVFAEGQENPLRLISRLQLPIFITTSYFDFIYRALTLEEVEPRLQVCKWSSQIRIADPAHQHDPAYTPDAKHPLVFHLHGWERYPDSLVLSEDDHLDFLYRLAQDDDTQNPVIPLYLYEALATSSLLLLGFHLWDWDFRVLLRGLLKHIETPHRKFNLAIQLNPEGQSSIRDFEKARRYLQDYLGNDYKFEVIWCDTETFIRRLWEEWKKAD